MSEKEWQWAFLVQMGSQMTDHLLARSESCVNMDKYGGPRKYVTGNAFADLDANADDDDDAVHSGTRVRRSFSVPSIPAKMRIAPSPAVVLKPCVTRRARVPRFPASPFLFSITQAGTQVGAGVLGPRPARQPDPLLLQHALLAALHGTHLLLRRLSLQPQILLLPR